MLVAVQVFGGWDTGESVQEQRGFGGDVSEESTHENIFQPLERRQLGNKRRACEDRLDQSPLRCVLQEF